MNKAELINIIVAELTVICEENDINCTDLNSETVLFGANSIIDSLALVGLVIKVEDYITKKTGKEIQVIDEEAIITDGNTPFRNAVTLAEHAILKFNAA